MSFRNVSGLLLLAAFAAHASLEDARAAQGSVLPSLTEVSAPASIPDEARIASDLHNHYRFGVILASGAGFSGSDKADKTAIRSSVRKGEVLEFRVTSVRRAAPDGGLQREMDSIVSYRMQGDGWTLLGVEPEATREVVPTSTNATGDC